HATRRRSSRTSRSSIGTAELSTLHGSGQDGIPRGLTVSHREHERSARTTWPVDADALRTTARTLWRAHAIGRAVALSAWSAATSQPMIHMRRAPQPPQALRLIVLGGSGSRAPAAVLARR